MYNHLSAIVLFLTFSFWGTVAHAGNTLTLKDNTPSVNLSPYIRIIKDSKKEYSAQDIILRYKNNIRGTQNKKDVISVIDTPTWIAIEINNNSTSTQWALNFGNHGTSRTGIISKLYVYDVNNRHILYDGLDALQKKHNLDKNILVNLSKREKTLYLIYIEPQIYKPITFSPHIQKINFKNETNFSIKSGLEILFTNSNLVIVASFASLLITFLITKFVGLLPLTTYYAFLFFWINHFEAPFFSSMLGTDILPTILYILYGVCILSIVATSIPANKNTSISHYFIYAVIGFFFLSMYAIISNAIGVNGLNISFGLLLVSYVLSIFFLTKNSDKLFKPTSRSIALWMSILTLGHTIVFLSSKNPSLAIPTLNNIDYIALYPQFLCVIFICINIVRHEMHRRILYVTRKAQKTQELLKAQKSKESNDHSRLLRVIEREREIMEELRGRESERAEEMRQAKIAADEANQAQAAFLAIVSHEIRTPMTGVIGMLRLLEDSPLNDEQKQYLMTIKDSGDAMVSLLNDILDFSKIKDGGMTLEEIEFDLKRVANGVVMLMKGHADQKNINLVLDIDENAPATLYGDPTRLRQVFLNLIGNALKFTERGHVALRIHANETNPNTLKFIIEDTGIGISKEAQEKLFTPFAQADSSISRKYGGTGLGLTICQKLVNAMGGQIEIDSTEGVGTQFYFTIPFKELSNNSSSATSVKKENTATTPSQESTKNILIVDDNDVNQKVISSLLAQKKHTFTLASSGKESLNILNADQSFDIVLLDIEMPDMNGKDVAKAVLDDEKTADIPLIALTGNVSDADIQTYLDIGFKGHLAKPINPEKLFSTIANTKTETFEIKTQRHDITLSEEDLNEDSFVIAETKIIEENKKKKLKNSSISTLDKAMLSGLKDGLGIAQTKDFINDLYIKTDEIIEQMKQSLTPLSLSDMKDRSHELKGMAANFGLKALSDVAAKMEKIVQKPDTKKEDISPRIEELETLLERSKIAVDDFLKN